MKKVRMFFTLMLLGYVLFAIVMGIIICANWKSSHEDPQFIKLCVLCAISLVSVTITVLWVRAKKLFAQEIM